MISPTGKGIRIDRAGNGMYGASRGLRKHKGCDFLCIPGQEVYAPISGTVEREAKPYADKEYSGLVIQGKHMSAKMFYLIPARDIIGKQVHRGDVVGYAQDISQNYPGEVMKPHVHIEVESMNVLMIMEMFE